MRRGRAKLGAVVAASTLTIAGAALVTAAPALATEVYTLPSSGTITVQGHGNGHGHGMAQYGAYGAALAGKTAAQIVAFYYPGTTLVTLAASTIRVALSGGLAMTTVAATSTLHVTGRATALPSTGITQYRLAPSGSGFIAQALQGGTWTNIVSGLGAQADFSDPTAGYVRMYRADGTTTDYRGSVGGLRSGSGQLTINRLPLDSYVEGVVPREMPASWSPAAVQAQAIAARSYARNAVESNGSDPDDICDSDQCQVYGGMRHLDSAGNVLWTDDPAAITGDANQVLQYKGVTIFAQFSASDGGWTVAGGTPYLMAQADPYDDAASGDPYLNWTRTPSVASIASYFGLKTATSIGITSRDGHGDWGGRVLAGYVDGTNSSGAAQQISVTGFDLQNALGLPHNWFVIGTRAPTEGATTISSTPTSVSMFFLDNAGNLQDRTYVNGKGWQTPVNLGTVSAGLMGDPDAATWGGGHIDVAIRDRTGHLAIRSYTTADGWLPWQEHTAVMDSNPAAVSPVPNSLYIYYLGPNHQLWSTRWRYTTGWNTPAPIPGVTNAASGPDAMAALETTTGIILVYRGLDGKLWTVQSTPTQWLAPAVVNPTHALPSPAAAVDPSVVDDGAGGPSYYYTATNGAIYHSYFNTTTNSWGPWFDIPGSVPTTSAPDVSDEGATHVDVIATAGGMLRTTAWNSPGGWSPWSPLS